MARVVLIVDSATGELIDMAGNGREGGRYRRFVGRLLSKDGTQLDYGANGGDSLTISRGGARGSEIKLLADTVSVPGALKIGGRTVEEISVAQSLSALDRIMPTKGEISVTDKVLPDPSSGEDRRFIQISLDESVMGSLEMIGEALKTLPKCITQAGIAGVVRDLKVESGDTLDDVKGTLRVLLERLEALAGVGSSSSSSS